MSFFVILDVITYASPILLLYGCLIGLRYYESLGHVQKLVLIYFLMCLIIEISSHVISIIYKNNLLFIPLFGLLELIVLTTLYRKYLLRKENKILNYSILASIAFILYELISISYFDVAGFQSYSRVIDTFLIVCMSLLFLKQKINGEPNFKHFVLNAVILVYFSLNLIIFLPINFLINEGSMLKFYFWMANLIFTLFFYTALIFILWKHGKAQRQLLYGFP